MIERLDGMILTGRREQGLVDIDGQRLAAQAADAFRRLQARAREAGFTLAIASGFRSYERQLAIFNAKASGERPVHDDAGAAIDMAALAPREQLAAILRFSALPGASRHHWGSDLDVFDAAALPADYRGPLTPEEGAPDGVFGPLHAWLDERMAADESEGFFRPYDEDRGGVAPERWHLSFAPLALAMERALTPAMLQACWCVPGCEPRWQEQLQADIGSLWQRYVSVPADWCPEDYRRAS